ncbi:MAG: cytochrome b [Rhodobacteraceae bacterium]|jgi:cytochrome b561|nr:cytochrome b [Paracoccaceae bacterium]
MSTQGYAAPARALHWIMAVLILLTIPAGFVMVQPGIGRSLQNALFIYHKNVGVLLLLLVILRIVWRLRNPAPPLPGHMAGWQAGIARLTHLALYVLLVILPVAGYIRVRAGGFPIESLDALGLPALVPRSDALAETAKAVHYFAGLAIAAVVAMHVGAALLHGIVLRDGVFSRMWPPVGRARR